jgi:hypothetical protein
MAKIKTEADFNNLSRAEQLQAAKNPKNTKLFNCVLAQVMPHHRLSDLIDEQLIQVAEVALSWGNAIHA